MKAPNDKRKIGDTVLELSVAFHFIGCASRDPIQASAVIRLEFKKLFAKIRKQKNTLNLSISHYNIKCLLSVFRF